MFGLDAPELIIIALVVLILFGTKKMPEAARALGRSLRIFKAETRGLREDEQANRAPPASSASDGVLPPDGTLPPARVLPPDGVLPPTPTPQDARER